MSSGCDRSRPAVAERPSVADWLTIPILCATVGRMDIQPDDLKNLGLFMAVLFLRDLSLAALLRLAKKARATPDKSDDWVADVADVVAAAVQKIPVPAPMSKKK